MDRRSLTSTQTLVSFAAQSAHRSDVRTYYEGTALAFRLAWFRRGTASKHFGYFDDRTRSHGESLRRMTEELLSAVDLASISAACDAGCGVGATSQWLASRSRAQVIGLTLTPGEAMAARQEVQVRSLRDRCRFIVADYDLSPFANESLDLVVAHESVYHSPDKCATLREFSRVLRPSGYLAVADFWLAPNRDVSQLVTDWCVDWLVPNFTSIELMADWARAIGFVDVRTRDVSEHVAKSVRRLSRIARFFLPLATLARSTRLMTEVHYGNVRGSMTLRRALASGDVRYSMLIARKASVHRHHSSSAGSSSDTLS